MAVALLIALTMQFIHSYRVLPLLFLSVWAYGIDVGSGITISDKNYDAKSPTGSANWYSNREDNETELNPATITKQVWDLEGMFVNDNALSLVGGFDFRNGQLEGGKVYKSGDIFIDIDGDAKYGKTANGSSGTTPHGGTQNVLNSFGYDYVIDFNSTMTEYNVFQIAPTSLVRRVTDVPSSNPWRYVSGGLAVSGFQGVAIGGYGQLAAVEYNTLSTFGSTTPGLIGDSGSNKHFYLTVDLSFLPADTLTTLHYTIECGNDNLMGQFTTPHVPDVGGTLPLLALALLGIVAGRYRLGFRT